MPTTTSATTSTTTTSAAIGSQLITALGLGTGADMTALATNIANADFADKNNAVSTRLTKVQLQISQASQLKSDMLALANSLSTLINSGNLAAAPSVANASVASASLPPGASGAAGSYSLEVAALASSQVLNSPGFASSSAVAGSGSLTINFGTIAGSGFTADAAHAPVTIAIASGATLADVAQAINGSGAGVTAYIATGSDGAHLVLKGATGAGNGFTVSASEAAGDPGLAALTWQPASGASARLAASAADAAFKLDGIARSSASNAIANAAPGLSLNLTGTNAGSPTTINFANPTSNIAGAMQNMTSALNSLVSELNTDRSASGGGLSGDSGARTMARQLAALPGLVIMPGAAAGVPATLADLGLAVTKDGSFALNGSVLSKALAGHPAEVAAMFTNGINGVFNTIENLTIASTAPNDPGSLSGSVTRYAALQTQLTTQQTKLTSQQDALRTRLITQYAAANAAVSRSKSTGSYLTEQIAAWNKSGN